LVVWLPALCRKKDVPYCIVKSKSRLGQVVHQKTASVLAITEVEQADQAKLADLTTSFKELYNNNIENRRAWGGSKLSLKARIAQKQKAKLLAREKK
jgi:large subunit ribosomal protein L7Ae